MLLQSSASALPAVGGSSSRAYTVADFEQAERLQSADTPAVRVSAPLGVDRDDARLGAREGLRCGRTHWPNPEIRCLTHSKKPQHFRQKTYSNTLALYIHYPGQALYTYTTK